MYSLPNLADFIKVVVFILQKKKKKVVLLTIDKCFFFFFFYFLFRDEILLETKSKYANYIHNLIKKMNMIFPYMELEWES